MVPADEALRAWYIWYAVFCESLTAEEIIKKFNEALDYEGKDSIHYPAGLIVYNECLRKFI